MVVISTKSPNVICSADTATSFPGLSVCIVQNIPCKVEIGHYSTCVYTTVYTAMYRVKKKLLVQPQGNIR